MKTIKFAAYLFYRYYTKEPQRGTPYFRTLASLTLLMFLNILFLTSLVGKGNFIYDAIHYFKINKTIVILICMSIIGIIVGFVIRKKELDELGLIYGSDKNKIKKGNAWLILYCILSFILIIFGAYWNKYINAQLP